MVAEPTPCSASAAPGSQIRPMMRRKDGRSPECTGTGAIGNTISKATSGTAVHAAKVPANPMCSNSASPIGLPNAKAA